MQRFRVPRVLARTLVPGLTFPYKKVLRTAIDATLRLAQADAATLVPAHVAMVPMRLSLEAAISSECEAAMPLLEAIEQRATRGAPSWRGSCTHMGSCA